MAKLYRKSPKKNDQPMLATELHRQIEQQTADFLKRGGEIQYIRNGSRIHIGRQCQQRKAKCPLLQKAVQPVD